jgi:hypothetical protein
MTERTLVAYRNGDFVDMCNLGTVRYRLVVQFNLDMRMLQLDQC